MITHFFNTMKEGSTVNVTQSVKSVPIFTCENETSTNNISDIKTDQSKREKSIDVTSSNDNTETNNQTLKISLFEHRENVNCHKKEE